MEKLINYGIALILVCGVTKANAQVQTVELYRTELSLKSVDEKYGDVNGSPYVYEKWVPGSVTTVDKKTRGDMLLKFDEIDELLIMSGDNDQMLTFSVPVAEFSLVDPKSAKPRVFRSGFTANKGNSEKSFFEVLHDGKVQFLRKNHKVISKSTAYSGAVVKNVADGIKYYLVNADNTPVLLKLDLKSVNELLPGKESQLTEYAKTNKLNVKNQEDMIKLIAYYNTL